MKNIKHILLSLSVMAISSIGFAANVNTEAKEELKIETVESIDLEIMEETTFESSLMVTFKDAPEIVKSLKEAIKKGQPVLIVGSGHSGICSEKDVERIKELVNDNNVIIINSDTLNEKIKNEHSDIVTGEELKLKDEQKIKFKPILEEGNKKICPMWPLKYSTSPKEHFGKSGLKRCRS